MVTTTSSIVIFALCALASQSEASFRPYRLSYTSLVDGSWNRDGFLSALSGLGMISVVDLPIPLRMVENQHNCLVRHAGQVIEAVDGTIRYTVATETVGGSKLEPIPVQNSKDSSCSHFLQGSQEYRSQVNEAVNMFAQGLQELIGLDDQPVNPESSIPNVADLILNGRSLEHFHSYLKKESPVVESLNTLDWHIDQGLFLAFAPGRWSHSGQTTRGFFVRTRAGITEEVIFDNDVGLVFMLGDGVNNYINDHLPGEAKKLRGVPHSLQIPPSSDSRVWYGLMVLPPLNDLAHSGDVGTLSCTQGLMTARSGRLLDDLEHQNHTVLDHEGNHTAASVDEFGCVVGGEVYCWHRCMNIEESLTEISAEQCEAGGNIVTCINPRRQIWEGKRHGDFYPGCVPPETEIETPFPTLPGFPRDDELCDSFEAFMAEDVTEYEHQMPLLDKGDAAVGVFQWTVKQESGEKSLSGRVAFNGIFGYLAFGLVGEGGKEGHTYHMLNAPVLMAFPGSNYSAFAGLDLDMEPTIAEYLTHTSSASFRKWSTPYSATEFRSLRKTDHEYSVSFDECYTSMTFSNVVDIAGFSLDLDRTDEMIWGANNQDYFVQYHGTNRKVFDIEWNSEESLIQAASTGIQQKTGLALLSLVSSIIWAIW